MLAFILPQNIPLWLHVILVGFTLLWLFSYQAGLALNIQPFHFSRGRRIKEHAIVLMLTVPLGLIETYAAFTAPFYMRGWVWVSTPKSRSDYYFPNLLPDFVRAKAAHARSRGVTPADLETGAH
jgi:hypothetical protein